MDQRRSHDRDAPGIDAEGAVRPALVEAPAFLDETLKAVGPEFAVALGVAFRKLQETA